jgi:hypothetical protein
LWIDGWMYEWMNEWMNAICRRLELSVFRRRHSHRFINVGGVKHFLRAVWAR